ncbi:hypothetical protein [Gorillibacterium massiliense]|uniref:hypothetical protein n=1 Tax=Gorillibacterium massiliense TaxID=1280390 RepID=UPI0004BAA874|nr:hypothetical protein [Gorillibacterium massiliense]
MKRFVMGLICGFVLSGASVAAASVSNEVKARLYPTLLHLFVDGKESSSSDVSVLNYNNRLYVPLRAFSEVRG